MKNRKITLLTITALLLIVGALTTATVFAGPAAHSTSDVVFFDPQGGEGVAGDTVAGASSTLVRTDNGISITVHTSDLLPGTYTNWWVIFNNPSGCTPVAAPSCGLNDLGNADAEAAVKFATGHVVSKNGKGNFGAHLSVGDDSGEIFGELTNPMGAEVHYIIRYHGPKQKGLVDDQIGTVGGGCGAVAPLFPCYDPQVTIHNP